MEEKLLHRCGYVHGFVAGALVSTALLLAACATGGAQSSSGTEAGRPAAAPAPEAAPAEPEAPAPAPAPAAPPVSPPGPDPDTASAVAAPDQGDAAGSPVAAYLADPQAMGRAHQLFRAVCTGYCHSTQPTADRVAPNLFDCAWDHGSTDEAIFQSIAAGIPDTQMQGFGERLPNEDLWKLVAYVRQRSTCE